MRDSFVSRWTGLCANQVVEARALEIGTSEIALKSRRERRHGKMESILVSPGSSQNKHEATPSRKTPISPSPRRLELQENFFPPPPPLVSFPPPPPPIPAPPVAAPE